MRRYDVIVIGSGLVGVSTAYELARAGKKTALLDAGNLSRGASAANTGLLLFEGLTEGTIFDLCLESLRRYRNLEAELGSAFGFSEMNFLAFFQEEGEEKLAKERELFYQKYEFPYRVLTPEQLTETEPALHLKNNLGGAYYTQWVMDPLRLVYAYFCKAKSMGTDWFPHTEVTGFAVNGNVVEGVQINGGDTLYADQIVVASGAWTRDLMKTLGVNIPIYYIQGACMALERASESLRHTVGMFVSPRIQMERRASELLRTTAFEELPDSPELHGNEFIIVPDTNGNHLVAQRSCVRKELYRQVPNVFLQDMCRNVAEYLPSMSSRRVIRSWITPVPFVQDENPFWGRLSAYPNVVLSAGYGSVLIMAPMIGEVTKQLVLDETIPYDLRDYNPDRTV